MIVTGGIGLAPLRPLIDWVLADRDRVRAQSSCTYGARTPRDRLFVDELDALARRGVIEVARDRRPCRSRSGSAASASSPSCSTGSCGSATATVAFICGPERMMQATVDVLHERGVARRAHLADARAAHGLRRRACAATASWAALRLPDGPVFSLAELGTGFGREGL